MKTVTERKCTRETLGITWRYLALDTRVICVAIKGEVNDWAAYIGAVEGKSHAEEAQSVAENGSKLDYWIARKLFPSMDNQYAWRD